MSLTQALNTSANALRLAQAGLSLVSSNVANADTPGYVRKSLIQTTTGTDAFGAGVNIAGVNRELDLYIQRQLRVESAGGAYADMRARFYDRLQLLFGSPGADNAFETTFNNFTTALQTLATSPESLFARSAVLNTAQTLARQLNDLSGQIQGLRAEAENGLADATTAANEAMQGIARLNQQLAVARSTDPAATLLMDQRDRYIDQLSQLMDIRVIPSDGNQLVVYTNSGVQLVGLSAARLEFDAQGTMSASQQWNADPSRSGVGTLMMVSPTGDSIDLLAGKSVRSGTIAAYVEMRDQALVAVQTQLDAFAATMSQALSDTTTPGAAVSAGVQDGFDVDLAGLVAGNTVRLGYTETGSGARKSVTFVRVDNPAALPLSGGTSDDRIVGINFAGGPASVAAQVAAALGPGFSASNPSGTLLRVLDNGGATVTMTAASSTRTATGLSSGGMTLPFFVDGSGAYTGATTASGAQFTGFAGRISVNAALLSDPAKLVAYSATTAAGDDARVRFIYEQMSGARVTFATQPNTSGRPGTVQTSLPEFLRQVIAQQGEDAAAAASLQEGQKVVVDALAQRMSDTSSVNIDQEMANLLQLQSAYSANARVLQAVKEMLDMLARI